MLFNCREPFEIEVIDFENVLVVEGTLTNEMTYQEVKLSRTYALNETQANNELNATVWVEDNQSNVYVFTGNGQGIYTSNSQFQAKENTIYKLYITTANGKQYASNETILTPIDELTDLYAELITTVDNREGIQVMVNSDNASGLGKYYRYEYEETYKIVAPNYYRDSLRIEDYYQLGDGTDGVGFTPYFIPRNGLGQICYTTKSNIGTIQTTTTELNDNIISRFPLRFIAKTDPIIKERYSILVRQYVQSIEAYTFYKIISELGSVQSILSQNQPGYVAGNIKSLSNPDEKILGYFETSSVSSKRIYFNYSDFQIDVPPPYFYECLSITLDFLDNRVQILIGTKELISITSQYLTILY